MPLSSFGVEVSIVFVPIYECVCASGCLLVSVCVRSVCKVVFFNWTRKKALNAKLKHLKGFQSFCFTDFLAKAAQASISGRNVVIECSDIGKVARFHHLVL